MFKLSPSKAHRYLQCTKSLEYDVEFVETPQTKRGSLLHKIAETMIKSQPFEELLVENGVDDYEFFILNSYVDSVFRECHRLNCENIEVEQKRSIKIFDININLIIDAMVVGTNEASIIDLKTGNGDVEVVDNEQLYFYAYALLTEKININKVSISISQKGKLKTIVLTREQVFDFFIEKENVFENIKNKELSFNPSEKACKFCAIKKTCVARANWIINGKQPMNE